MTPDAPTIYQAMAAVLAELPAIGKNQTNSQQGYKFRGVDDVIDALNPLLAKHGLFFLPDVIERLESSRQTRNGGTMWVVNLHVKYTFYGPAGDSVEASGWGEGTDSGDKATQKAMTGAMKYVLFQVFAIATSEQAASDADHSTPEETISPVWRQNLKVKADTLHAEGVDMLAKRREWKLPPVGESDGRQLGLWEEMLRTIEAEREAPFVKADA